MARRRVASLALIAAAVAVMGFTAAPTLSYNPQHYVNNDPIWDEFNQTRISPDLKIGEYRASFPQSLASRQNRPMRVAGFILPLEASSRSAHFMLVRRNTGCPFCPPNAPTEAVEIYAEQPVNYTGQEMAATGRLKLVASSADGLFFRLEQASVVTTGH